MNTVEVLARTIWAEARGDGYIGMQAVANVIVNRANNPRWWGNDIKSVCMKPYQFTCWNHLTVGSDINSNYIAMRDVRENNRVYVMALDIAEKAANGELADITENSDHYHAGRKPKWAKEEVVKVIKNHTFYRLELDPPLKPKPERKPVRGLFSWILSVFR